MDPGSNNQDQDCTNQLLAENAGRANGSPTGGIMDTSGFALNDSSVLTDNSPNTSSQRGIMDGSPVPLANASGSPNSPNTSSPRGIMDASPIPLANSGGSPNPQPLRTDLTVINDYPIYSTPQASTPNGAQGGVLELNQANVSNISFGSTANAPQKVPGGQVQRQPNPACPPVPPAQLQASVTFGSTDPHYVNSRGELVTRDNTMTELLAGDVAARARAQAQAQAQLQPQPQTPGTPLNLNRSPLASSTPNSTGGVSLSFDSDCPFRINSNGDITRISDASSQSQNSPNSTQRGIMDMSVASYVNSSGLSGSPVPTPGNCTNGQLPNSQNGTPRGIMQMSPMSNPSSISYTPTPIAGIARLNLNLSQQQPIGAASPYNSPGGQSVSFGPNGQQGNSPNGTRGNVDSFSSYEYYDESSSLSESPVPNPVCAPQNLNRGPMQWLPVPNPTPLRTPPPPPGMPLPYLPGSPVPQNAGYSPLNANRGQMQWLPVPNPPLLKTPPPRGDCPIRVNAQGDLSPETDYGSRGSYISTPGGQLQPMIGYYSPNSTQEQVSLSFGSDCPVYMNRQGEFQNDRVNAPNSTEEQVSLSFGSDCPVYMNRQGGVQFQYDIANVVNALQAQAQAQQNPGNASGGQQAQARQTPGYASGGQQAQAQQTPGYASGGQQNPGNASGGQQNPGNASGGQQNPGNASGGQQAQQNPGNAPGGQQGYVRPRFGPGLEGPPGTPPPGIQLINPFAQAQQNPGNAPPPGMELIQGRNPLAQARAEAQQNRPPGIGLIQSSNPQLSDEIVNNLFGDSGFTSVIDQTIQFAAYEALSKMINGMLHVATPVIVSHYINNTLPDLMEDLMQKGFIPRPIPCNCPDEVRNTDANGLR